MKVLTEQEGQVDIGPDWNHYANRPRFREILDRLQDRTILQTQKRNR